jgi:hypothetical protein
MPLICFVTFARVASNVLIFVCTYDAVVRATTMSASLFAASATFFPCVPVTVSEISGCVRAAPAPALPIVPTETCPRSAAGRMSA